MNITFPLSSSRVIKQQQTISAVDQWIAMQVLFGDAPKKSDIEKKIEKRLYSVESKNMSFKRLGNYSSGYL